MKVMKIGNRYVGGDNPVFIIAEAGVNHNGDAKLAFKMVEEASKLGVDAIKFQTFLTKETVSSQAPLAEHHIANVKDEVSHFRLIKKLELPFTVFKKLKSYAEKKGLIFISTPYDIFAARYLISIKVPAIKIASAEVENSPLLDEILKSKVPVILSTGMNDLKILCAVIKKILENGNETAILKCTSNYPVDYANVNLLGIKTLKVKFGNCVIGFSDHTQGYEVACAAVALGAKIIEKHFTLNKSLWGPDHKASADVDEFKRYVEAIRRVEKSLGSTSIQLLACEHTQKTSMQKSIFARHDIPRGKKVTMDDLAFLRPSGGIPPFEYKKIIGKKCRVDIAQGTKISWTNFSGK